MSSGKDCPERHSAHAKFNSGVGVDLMMHSKVVVLRFLLKVSLCS